MALLAVIVSVGGCTSATRTPLAEPQQVMTVAWGPFARQCATTRTSDHEITGRAGPSEAATYSETCTGFSAMPASGGAMQITGSTTTSGQTATPLISRILRAPGGVSRAAAAGDTGLLAQGSDSPRLAAELAEDIGVARQQTIAPNGELRLPIRLNVQFPVDGTLSCRPDGARVDRGRNVLVFSCAMDEQVHASHLDGRVQLAGVEELDVLTGVRLTSSLAGSITGHERADAGSRWRPVDYSVWYSKTTDLE